MEGKKWGRPGNEADDGNQESISIHVLNLSVVTIIIDHILSPQNPHIIKPG